ncbi:MAG: hypothetical protein PF495_16535 [Spirochaetales bacterium]|jgi:hypothetical protein|nr:hypothetical protein [Spirochaetales bacterium]
MIEKLILAMAADAALLLAGYVLWKIIRYWVRSDNSPAWPWLRSRDLHSFSDEQQLPVTAEDYFFDLNDSSGVSVYPYF